MEYFITMFFMDTCFCLHLQNIYNSIQIDFRPFLMDFQFGITKNVLWEYEHYKCIDVSPINQMYLAPISNLEIEKLIKKYLWLNEFDKADQELILLGIRDNAVILTDDNDLLHECINLKIQALRLPVFLIMLKREWNLPKNLLSKTMKFWVETKRYAKKDLERWKKELLE